MTKKNNTLITVLGSSPQVMTETLFALKDSGFPQRIIVFTTKHGASQLEKLSVKSHVKALCHDYRLAIPTLSAEDIHIVKDIKGEQLDDIRNSEDQEAMADQITRVVRTLVQDDATAIHASIAGGRKSMSFYMGYIFSIFARSCDKLSHVLVPPAFESNNFWYPTPHSSPFVARINYTTGEKTTLDAKNAMVELAEIPFLRINAALVSQSDLLTQEASYRETLTAYQLALTPENIRLEFTADYRVLLNGNALDLAIETIAFYRVIARSCFQTPSYTRGKLANLETPLLEELAYISQTPFEEGFVIDVIEEIAENLQDNCHYSVNKRWFTSINENGLSKNIEGGMKTEISRALKKVAVSITIDLCEVCIVKSELNSNNQRERTKGGVLGLQLNPEQIIFS